MPVFISPGVYFRTIDLSLYAPRLSTCTLGSVGTATKGPVNERVYISSFAQLIREFGPPNPNHLAIYSHAQFLTRGNRSWFVRVSDGSETRAQASLLVGEGPARITGAEDGPFVFEEASYGTLRGAADEPYVITTSTPFVLTGGIMALPATNLANFQSVSDGAFDLTYVDRDGVSSGVIQITGLDFANYGGIGVPVADLGEVASLIQSAIRTTLPGKLPTFIYNGTDRFIFTSDPWDTGSNVVLSIASATGSGTDIYPTTYMEFDSAVGTVGADGNDIMAFTTDLAVNEQVRLPSGSLSARDVADAINGQTTSINAWAETSGPNSYVYIRTQTLGSTGFITALAVSRTVEAYTDVMGAAFVPPVTEFGSNGTSSLDIWVNPWGFYKSGNCVPSGVSNLSNFKSVSAGRITVTLDGGAAFESLDCDFTSASSMNDVALELETKINAAAAAIPISSTVRVIWSEPYFYIVSQDASMMGSSSAVIVSAAVTPGKTNLHASSFVAVGISTPGKAMQRFMMPPGNSVTVNQVVSSLGTLNGAKASNYLGYLRIETELAGPSSYILIDPASTADSVLGLDNSDHYGIPFGSPSLRVMAPTPGTAGNNLTVMTMTSYKKSMHMKWIEDHAGDIPVPPETESPYYPWRSSFKLEVYDSGYKVGSFDNLIIDDPTSDDYVAKVLGTTLDTYRSDRVIICEVLEPIPPTAGYTYALLGGTDGIASPADINYVGRINPDGSKTGMQLYCNPNEIDINLLIVPGISSPEVVDAMIFLCESRGDSMCIFDPPFGLDGPSKVVDYTNRQGDYSPGQPINSYYAATYWPWIEVYDSYNNMYVWTPPSGHAAAVYAYTDYVSWPWFAPAGLNRAHIIAGRRLEQTLTQGDMDLLYGYPNVVNPICNFIPDGITIWGQKSCQRKPSALDRVNVVRMLLYARKLVATVVKYLVFEPNDETTWDSFIRLCKPIFEEIKTTRGLYDFSVICDSSTTTPDMIDRNEMGGRIYLKPTKSAEKIIVDFVLTSTGASFDEIKY